MPRWECPNGHRAVIGPSKPRRDNICRYCLQCSANQGKLVERVCPTLDKKRTKRAELVKAKVQRKREQQKEAMNSYPWNLYGLAKEWAKLKAWEADLSSCEVKIRQGTSHYSSGHAWGRRRIVVTAGMHVADGKAVLLHELAHIAANHYMRKHPNLERAAKRSHGRIFTALLLAAANEVLGIRVYPGNGTARGVQDAVRNGFQYVDDMKKAEAK